MPRSDFSRDLCDECAACGEAVEQSDTDLELRALPVDVPSGPALAERVHTVPLGFGGDSAVILAPSLLDGSADMHRYAQDRVARDGPRAFGRSPLGSIAGR